MRNLGTFLVVAVIMAVAVAIGMYRRSGGGASSEESDVLVPHIGRVQVLNGCGVSDAAWKTAEVIRSSGFDVRNDEIGNASSFDYPFTLVVSRSGDMTIAREVGEALGVSPDRVILLRDTEGGRDVTVVVGHDFQRLIQ